MQAKTVTRFWSDYAKKFASFYTSGSIVDFLFRRGMHLREEHALDLVTRHRAKSVLDIGCGSGRQVLAAVGRGAERAVGVDAAPGMLDLARQAAAAEGLADKVEFHLADMFDYRDDRTYDLVWALGVFDYVPDPDRLVRVLVARSRGLVAASFRRVWVLRAPFRKVVYALRGSPVYFYTSGEIEALFRRNGLIDVEVKTIDRAVYFATGRVKG